MPVIAEMGVMVFYIEQDEVYVIGYFRVVTVKFRVEHSCSVRSIQDV